MASPEPLVNFYDLSGPKPWSPACWCTRFALNYKRIPYKVTKLSYPAIKPTCEKLLSSKIGTEGFDFTVPIIEILSQPYEALNDSAPIARLLNERFPEKDGYPELKLIDEAVAHEDSMNPRDVAMGRWILYDVYLNALDPLDGSKEFFKSTREAMLKMELKDVVELKGGGDAALLEEHKKQWLPVKERMAKEDGKGAPTYVDFYDAAVYKWVGAASTEKAERLRNLYGDDTFVKLLSKVKPYEA